MIELSLDLNKCNKSFQNRIVVRQGDVGEKILISIYDNKKPAALTEQHKVKLEGNLKNGDYVESEANLYNSEKGKYVFQFQSKDVSIIGEYQRAFLRIYDENDNRVSSEEVHIEVLKDADISQSQATTYVSQLDNVLENMDKEFDSFMDEKEVDYEKLDEKCDEIGTELIYIQNESKGIKKTQSDILQSIKDNELTTKTELEIENQKSSANVVYQIIGKDEVEVTLTLNLKNKIVGSFDENKNMAKGGGGNTLFLPTAPFSEFDNAAYRLIETLDSKAKFSTVGSVNGIAQIVLYYDVLGYVKDELGEAFFRDRGATTIAEQSSLIRTELITNYKARHFGYGLANAKNKLSMACRVFDSNSWVNTVSHTNSSISGLVIDTNYITNKIDNDGFANIIVFAEATDGTSSSQVITDYTSLEIKLKISANDHIKSLIAANHVQNLATQTEAEAGTDNSKSMTPLRTAQQIDKRAVTIAGNQTIGGIKNFKDGLMINDNLVVGINDHTVFYLNSTTSSVIADGQLCFILHGSLVVVEGSIKFKTDVAYVGLISSALPDLFVATINNGTLVGHIANNSAKGIYAEKGTNNIKANSGFVANEWFTCNGVYWAGKE